MLLEDIADMDAFISATLQEGETIRQLREIVNVRKKLESLLKEYGFTFNSKFIPQTNIEKEMGLDLNSYHVDIYRNKTYISSFYWNPLFYKKITAIDIAELLETYILDGYLEIAGEKEGLFSEPDNNNLSVDKLMRLIENIDMSVDEAIEFQKQLDLVFEGKATDER